MNATRLLVLLFLISFAAALRGASYLNPQQRSNHNIGDNKHAKKYTDDNKSLGTQNENIEADDDLNDDDGNIDDQTQLVAGNQLSKKVKSKKSGDANAAISDEGSQKKRGLKKLLKKAKKSVKSTAKKAAKSAKKVAKSAGKVAGPTAMALLPVVSDALPITKTIAGVVKAVVPESADLMDKITGTTDENSDSDGDSEESNDSSSEDETDDNKDQPAADDDETEELKVSDDKKPKVNDVTASSVPCDDENDGSYCISIQISLSI